MERTLRNGQETSSYARWRQREASSLSHLADPSPRRSSQHTLLGQVLGKAGELRDGNGGEAQEDISVAT